jgi:hypothetical protein
MHTSNSPAAAAACTLRLCFTHRHTCNRAAHTSCLACQTRRQVSTSVTTTMRRTSAAVPAGYHRCCCCWLGKTRPHWLRSKA